MKKIVSISIILFLLGGASLGQGIPPYHSIFEKDAFSNSTLDPVKILFATDSSIDLDKYNQYRLHLSEITQKLKSNFEKHPTEKAVEKLFYYTHRKMLKWYENYASFGNVFASGKYDCVSGSALLAILLNEMDVPYSIYEFDYHVLITVEVNKKLILLESTDPLNGVVKDQDEIRRRLTVYENGGDPSTYASNPIGSRAQTHSEHTYKVINLTKLAGLQYFNLAVFHLNQGQMNTANNYLQKASILYPSNRVEKVQSLISSIR